jgi:hypothetical protein
LQYETALFTAKPKRFNFAHDGRRISLSPRERAGVRGKATTANPTAKLTSKWCNYELEVVQNTRTTSLLDSHSDDPEEYEIPVGLDREGVAH